MHLQYLIANHLYCVSFYQNNIAKMIQDLDPNKAHSHGHDHGHQHFHVKNMLFFHLQTSRTEIQVID